MEPTPNRIPYRELELSGGVRCGQNGCFAWGTNWPFGQLRASPKELLFRQRGSWEPDLVLPKERVSKVARLRGFFGWGGTRFEHTVTRCPQYIAFYALPGDRDRLLSELRAMGYPVE